MTTIEIIAKTIETDNTNSISKMEEDLKIFSGKAAGVCYMAKDYNTISKQPIGKLLNRAESTKNRGHHSVFDHGHVTLMINTNKMIAMILNSLGVYTTSEKSARYTEMAPETELETQLYNKWINKLQSIIIDKYTDIDDDMLSDLMCKKMGIEKSRAVINGSCSHIKDDEFLENELKELKKSKMILSYKLAQENARYMISVFTPTTMVYTVSFRQLSYIIEYFRRLKVQLEYANDAFSAKLYNYVLEFYTEIRAVFGDIDIIDNKNQYIRFLEAQKVGDETTDGFIKYTDLESRLTQKKTVIADSYTITYTASLAMLAQAQRHRTLRYTMLLQEIGQFGYYVPPIIKNTELEDEWLNDIKSVAYCVPQGTLVRITEQGIFEDFAMKCKERLCGRAQLEIMNNTYDTLDLFKSTSEKYKDALSICNKNLLDEMVANIDNETRIVPRCAFKTFNCTDGCRWGFRNAFSRLI